MSSLRLFRVTAAGASKWSPPTASSASRHLDGRRHFFAYFRIAFNTVDGDRLKEVGPDRLCAEWLLKNGGSVKFAGKSLVSDYNALGSADPSRRAIEEVHAVDASIMAIGFDHFKGCNEVKKLELTRCKHMENEALGQLSHLKATLTELTVADCFNVRDSGLESLGELNQLNKLDVTGVPYVEDIDRVRNLLQAKLPKCEINITK